MNKIWFILVASLLLLMLTVSSIKAQQRQTQDLILQRETVIWYIPGAVVSGWNVWWKVFRMLKKSEYSVRSLQKMARWLN